MPEATEPLPADPTDADPSHARKGVDAVKSVDHIPGKHKETDELPVADASSSEQPAPKTDAPPASPEPEQTAKAKTVSPAGSDVATADKDQDNKAATVYLADLKPLNANVSRVGRTPKRVVQLNGVTSPHGIWTHPQAGEDSAHLEFELGGRFCTFAGAVGVDSLMEMSATNTPLFFTVHADKALCWQSRALQKRGSFEPFLLDVTGVKRLRIAVKSQSDRWAHAVWFEPRLTTIARDVLGDSDEGKRFLAQQLGQRRPVPAQQAQDEAEASIANVFGAEIKRAKTAGRQSALARKMLDAASRTADDSTACYVLLQKARQLAVEAGDIETGMRALDELGRRYDTDSLTEKQQLLAASARRVRFSPTAHFLTQYCFLTIDEAVAAGDLDTAGQLLNTARSVARRTRDKRVMEQFATRNEAMLEYRKMKKTSLAAAGVLAKSPDDPKANFDLGIYSCLIEKNWDLGLQKLAMSGQKELVDVIRQDSAVSDKPDEQLEIGDLWWDLTDGGKDPMLGSLVTRARYWYEKALSKAAGLNKSRVEHRLDQLDNSGRSTDSPIQLLKKMGTFFVEKPVSSRGSTLFDASTTHPEEFLDELCADAIPRLYFRGPRRMQNYSTTGAFELRDGVLQLPQATQNRYVALHLATVGNFELAGILNLKSKGGVLFPDRLEWP